MRRADFVTVAGCPPALAKSLNASPGFACGAAATNLGGNGNAVVANARRVDDVASSDYP